MRPVVICVTALVWLSAAEMARADWNSFWDRVHVDFMRMNCWPEPFVQADRDTVRTPLIAMTAAGWQLQNTLSDHFFHPDEHNLTQAGKLKVNWIVSQAPAHRRSVFVLRAGDQHSTQLRLESVRQVIAQFVTDGPQPDVVLTSTIPTGGSGAYFDEVDRQLKQSIPPPRLPERESTTGG